MQTGLVLIGSWAIPICKWDQRKIYSSDYIYRRAQLSPCTNLYREQKANAKQGSSDGGDKARLLISKPEIQKARITNALRVPKKSWPRVGRGTHTEKKANPQLNGEPANGNWLGISLQYTNTPTHCHTHSHVDVFPGRDFFFFTLSFSRCCGCFLSLQFANDMHTSFGPDKRLPFPPSLHLFADPAHMQIAAPKKDYTFSVRARQKRQSINCDQV